MAEALSMQQLGKIARRYWFVLVVAVAVGAAAGFFGARLMPPTYTATATELVKGVPGKDATANYQAAQYAISRARTYPVFIDSQTVLEGVRGDFGGRFDASALQDSLSSSNPVDTPLVQITAQAQTPEDARDMANSAARHMARYITQVETVNGASPVTVEIAVQATRPKDPTAPRPVLIAALTAFTAGCLALAGVVLFDRVVRPLLVARRRNKAAAAKATESIGDTAQPEPAMVAADEQTGVALAAEPSLGTSRGAMKKARASKPAVSGASLRETGAERSLEQTPSRRAQLSLSIFGTPHS